MTGYKVELQYSVRPDVLKPHVATLTTLSQLVKQEAASRVQRGEALTFHLDILGLCTIHVWPSIDEAFAPHDRSDLEFVVKRKDTPNGSSALAEQVSGFLLSEMTYPSEEWRARYDSLVGLKEVKSRVLDSLLAHFSEDYVRKWSQRYNYQTQMNTLKALSYPAYIFEGPQGVGKTELAHAIGDPLARALGREVVTYIIGLALRGEGLVGQLSQNISKMFAFAKMRHQERGTPVLLVLNEGDAIAQGREERQQHQEDRDGVSNLLQQIDELRNTPGIAIIFTSNRHSALDEAFQGRTNANRVRFPLPDYGMRFYLLMRLLGDAIDVSDMQSLAKATRGFSPRDITQVCMAAFNEARSKDSPITARQLMHAASVIGQLHLSRSTGVLTNLKADQEPRREQGVHVNGQSVKKAAA
jgi:SpoVK/Ycf46/Vps4 family AAA+-type ATPase